MEFKIPFNVLWGLDRAYSIQKSTQYVFSHKTKQSELEDKNISTTTIFLVNYIGTKDVHQPTIFCLMKLVKKILF